MAKKSSTRIYIIAFMLFLGGIGYLAFTGLKENSVYFLNVSEALSEVKAENTAARLFGTVAENDLAREQANLSFRLLDKDDQGKSIMVSYRGTVPDTFKPGAEVIVEGVLSSQGRFTAKTLMTKCPSKYEKENRENTVKS